MKKLLLAGLLSAGGTTHKITYPAGLLVPGVSQAGSYEQVVKRLGQ